MLIHTATARGPPGGKRPFLGPILLIMAGLIIGYMQIRFMFELFLISEAFPAIGLLFPILMFLIGVSALLWPHLSTHLGIFGVFFSLLSAVGGLGGLLVGLLLGIVGANLLIAWQPSESGCDREAQVTDTAKRRTRAVTKFSWQEGTITGTKDTSTTTIPRSAGPRTATSESKESSQQFAWQADPFAHQTTSNTGDVAANEKVEREPTTESDKDEKDARQLNSGRERGKLQNSGFLASSKDSDVEKSNYTEPTERVDEASSPYYADTDNTREVTSTGSSVDTHLEDALERVAHGAIVSFPSILFAKGISVIFTAILTNGFSASSYGLFVLAKKLSTFLENIVKGFFPGLKRFVPTASPMEREVFVTFVSLFMVGVGSVFGAGLFIAAPLITQTFGRSYQFQIFVHIFAVGIPLSLFVQTINHVLQSLEEVEVHNLLFRFCLPMVNLAMVAIGTFIFSDIVVVALGWVIITLFVSLILAGRLVWRGEFTPRIRGDAANRLRRIYLQFSIPMLVKAALEAIQGVSLYLLILFFLSDVAASVLTVGALIGGLISLPLNLNNQYMAPVVADLHENNHRKALARLYQVTSRLILVGVTGLVIPFIVYREAVMQIFGPTFVKYASLLPIFIFGHFVTAAAGSVGIIVAMTDHQRALRNLEMVQTLLIMMTIIPLVVLFGLLGVVASYFLKIIINNGLEVIALYHLEGYQPFTRRHAIPLLAALPLLLIALVAKLVLSGAAPIVGTLIGLAAYGTTLYMLGFTRTERRLARSLLVRYRKRFQISE